MLFRSTILGGCCGTTPEFIRQIHERFGTDAKVAASRRPDGIRYLTSERITHSFGLDDGFFVVGERINPTGKKALQAQLREGSFEKVIQFAEEQEACGAKVLDINMGMSGIDEKASMLRALEEVSGVTTLDIVAGEGRVGNEAGGNGLETTQLSNFTATSDNSGAKEIGRAHV